jgi:hypothetical protein
MRNRALFLAKAAPRESCIASDRFQETRSWPRLDSMGVFCGLEISRRASAIVCMLLEGSTRCRPQIVRKGVIESTPQDAGLGLCGFFCCLVSLASSGKL